MCSESLFKVVLEKVLIIWMKQADRQVVAKFCYVVNGIKVVQKQ